MNLCSRHPEAQRAEGSQLNIGILRHLRWLRMTVIIVLAIPLPGAHASSYQFSSEDLEFLDLVQKKAFEFFLYEHHPQTGLVKDRARNFGPDHASLASIAATGFGLSAMVVGAERGWIPKKEAEKYCEKTLRFFLEQMEANHGFYYHFVNWANGKRTKNTELSSIDTALLVAGALTAGEYFKGTKVEALAHQIYERIDFPWMLNGGKLLSMGWDPVSQRFLRLRWQDYNESFILYLLAIGSSTHPIPAASWHQVNKRIGVYGDQVLIYSPPLFTHQYPQVWADLRNKNDGFADYFENSRTATLVNRAFSLDHRKRFKTYSENVWGLTASDGPGGYRAYGGGPGSAEHDGTIAPTAAAGSIVFTPELSLKALRYMYENYKDRIWGKYGFTDAFNWDRKWVDPDVIGIDQGPIVLMIENARSELLWKLFMRHRAVIRGMEKIGFKPGTIKLQVPPRPRTVILSEAKDLRFFGLRPQNDGIYLDPVKHRELGEISGSADSSAKISMSWDSQFLYLNIVVTDDNHVAKRKRDQIWRDDLVEIFIDPQQDGFRWGNPKDIQLGLGLGPAGEARCWAWPKNLDPNVAGALQQEVRKKEKGYEIDAKIAWSFLGMTPQPGLSFGLTPAVHDLDADGSEGKLVWYFLPDGKTGANGLGEAWLE